MARKVFRFEGTDQSDATTASSSLSLLNRAGGIIKHDVSAKANGLTGLRFTSSGTGSYTIGRGTSSNSNNVHAFRGSFKIPSAPASDLGFGYIRNSINDVSVARFILKPTGAVEIYHAGNQPITFDAVGVIEWNKWYDLSLVLVGGSTTAGKITARLYETATGDQIGATRSTTTANMTANPINGFELGIVSSNPNATVMWDDVQIEDGQTEELGRLVPFSYIYLTSQYVSHTPHMWNGTSWVPLISTVLHDGDEFGAGPFGSGLIPGFADGFGAGEFGGGIFGGGSPEFGDDPFGVGAFGF